MEEKRDEIIVEKMLTDNRVVDSVNDILVELDRAEKKHPVWPADSLHQMAILQEKVGTAQMAANDAAFRLSYPDRIDHQQSLRRELVQVGAMAIRCLINLDGE